MPTRLLSCGIAGGGRFSNWPELAPRDKQIELAETQSAILPLMPYLDILRWACIAVALIGIAVAIFARIDDWNRGRR